MHSVPVFRPLFPGALLISSVFGTAAKLAALERFHPAEIYHQAYVTRNMNDPYVVENDLPKIEKFKTAFPQLYRR